MPGKIVMLCYKNGALAREKLRDRYAGGNWLAFNELVEKTPPGCNGFVGFYFPLPEIIPPNITGEFFFTTSHIRIASDLPFQVDDIPNSVHPRAILESQLLSIRSRIHRILPNDSNSVRRLVISGGSSTNEVIRQLAAVSRLVVGQLADLMFSPKDVFNLEVYVSLTEEGACYGGALLAKYLWWNKSNTSGSFEDMMRDEGGLVCVARPRPLDAQIYDNLVHVYEQCEQQLMQI